MAVDWMGFANAMSESGVNKGLAALAQGYDAGMKDREERQTRTLRDLQIQQSRATLSDLQRKQTQDEELQQALVNNTNASEEGPVRPQRTAQIIADTRMKQGRIEEAAKAVSLDDALAQYGAKLQSGGGDIQQYYAAKQELDQGKEFFEAVKPFAKNKETLKAMWPLLTKIYPKSAAISPDSIVEMQSGVAAPLVDANGNQVAGRYYLYDNDGKIHIIEDKPNAEAMMLKRDELQNARMDKQIAAADARLDKSIAAADRRAMMKGQMPGKPLPASQLESLSDAAQMIKTLKEAQQIAPQVSTGPIAGRAQSLGQLAGLSGNAFNQYKQKLSTVNNIMLKLRSGAAVTESEYNRFIQEMPTANDDEKVRDVKLANAISYAQELLNGKTQTYQEGGYKVPTGLEGRAQPKTATAPQPKAQPTGRPAPPKPGSVVKGYRFKGGNPADKNNWVKQ